ncbi:hypothetical protein JOC85_001315 [Bacillus mesophilus]|uniref:DUF3139 domain-containing protein n=1 Tax=Bacillus mesophilus TaxID=1808955 RepID=A0A6M0Q837_9BACI|nr:hypothetical protein [Bacillus mesophilus]MBM7660543.1 hypothetical protein [Bacillus mesophilus]NEY71909.1 hypothetical protein [Bacillus mesophilus]
MRILLIFVFVLLQLPLTGSQALAADYTNSQLFKVTISQNGEEVEYEFENPSHYEWEKGSTVIKGKEAEQKVANLYHQLGISAKTDVQEIKATLVKQGYTEMDHFVVRWIDQDEKLYTWHWEKEK